MPTSTSPTRPLTIALALTVAFLMAIPAVWSHAAGPPDGYTTILHDCGDDYGSHGVADSAKARPGHDLVGLWLREGERNGQPMVLLQITTSPGGAPDSGKREQFTLSTPRVNIDTTMKSSTEIAYVSGLEPAYVSDEMPAYKTDGSTDAGRDNYEIGFTYEQLKIANGEKLRDFQVVSLYKDLGGTEWKRGDRLAGGTYASGSYEEGCETNPSAPYFVAPPFAVQESTWSPPSTGGEVVADFTFAPDAPATGATVTFTDRSSGEPTAWSWAFGDGATSTQQNPTHSYTDDGDHAVTLTVTGEGGTSATVTKTVSVENRRPSVDFTFTPAQPAVDEAIEFTANATDPDGSIESYTWNLGDGEMQNGRTTTFTFDAAGEHVVRLTVTDDDGATRSVEKTLMVTAATSEDSAGVPGIVLVVALGLIGLAARRHGR